MKNMTKKMLAASLAAMLLAGSVTNISFADNHSEGGEHMEHSDKKMKWAKNGNRDGNKGLEATLTASETAALAELKEAKEASMEAMKAEYEALDKDDEEAVAEFKEKKMEMMEANKAAMMSVLANNSEALAEIEARQAEKGEMGEYKKGNKGEDKGLEATLTASETAALAELKEEQKESMEAMKEQKENWDEMSDEEQEALRAEYEAMKTAYKAEMKSILANNPEALAEIEAKEAKKSEMGEKRMKWEGKQDWEMNEKKGHGKKRWEMAKKYKKSFAAKIGNKLDTISDSKLEKLVGKIEEMEEKFEARTDMDEDKKETMMWKLQALKELIEEKLAA